MKEPLWLFRVSVVLSGEEQNKEALQDAEEETQWDWTTRDKPSSSSSSLISVLPALAPVPSHRFQLGLSCSPHSFSTFSSISTHLSHPLSSYARHLPTSSGSARVSGPTPRGVKPYFPWLILQACTQHVLPVLFCFCLFFALRCCIICCQVRLPVFVTHICKSFI